MDSVPLLASVLDLFSAWNAALGVYVTVNKVYNVNYLKLKKEYPELKLAQVAGR